MNKIIFLSCADVADDVAQTKSRRQVVAYGNTTRVHVRACECECGSVCARVRARV